MKRFWRQGEPFVWISGAALSSTLLAIVVLIVVVIANGMGVFWPHRVTRVALEDGTQVMGEVAKREFDPEGNRRTQFKVGNRDLYSLDFRWVSDPDIVTRDVPDEAVVLERQEYGNFYGLVHSVTGPNASAVEGDAAWPALHDSMNAILPALKKDKAIGQRINRMNRDLERIRRKVLKLAYHGAPEGDPQIVALEAGQEDVRRKISNAIAEQQDLRATVEDLDVTMSDAGGRLRRIRIVDIVRAYRPNQMSFAAKTGFYLGKLKELILGQPRESNTEGGLFPAIFGTVMLVFLMSILSFPLGVMAGIYLREYAREGLLVRLVRIGVNNLAGIPSIVYGVFGLGFFIYGLGGAIDRVFFPELLPTPTFGTGGILWAGLTLGLLTVPVVIVSTEEAFGSIPLGIREASLALGSTRLQTLLRVLFPMALPGILTGFILAMARAAGEVAPLMITGVVKLAPALPLDGAFPFLHLDRKFMHLGFHIYDIGFQSPNVEAAKPMVFVTTLLLVLIVLFMSSIAIWLRARMKKKFSIKAF